MKCPYCNKDMKAGRVPGDRYPLKWIPENDSILFSAFQKGIKLTDFWNDNSVEAYFCEECRKIIIDVPEENKK